MPPAARLDDLAPLRRLSAIAWAADTEPTEVGFGCLALAYGLVLTFSGDQMAAPSWRGIVRVLALAWPDHPGALLAILMFALGLAKVFGVLLDLPDFRKWVAPASVGLWLGLATSMLFSGPFVVGVIFHFGMAIGALWVFVRRSVAYT